MYRTLLLLLLIFILNSILLVKANPAILQEDGSYARQPHSIKMEKGQANRLALALRYVRGQNATFVIEPQIINDWKPSGCVEHVWIDQADLIKKPFCGEKILDLAPSLHEGLNSIVLEIRSESPEALLYVAPQLFGAHALSTLACLGLFGTIAALFFGVMQRLGLNPLTCCIAIAGMGYFALLLHFRENIYGEDIPGHIAYIRHMTAHWLRPYDYTGWESFHPPLYYFLCARVFEFFSGSTTIGPLMGVRIFTLGLYMIFCLYGLRTLDEAMPQKSAPYYAGVLLLVFWPVAIHLASTISNDIAVYAVWSAAFYYLCRWYRGQGISGLQLAIGLTGIALLIKSNALLMGGIIGGCMLYALKSGRLSLQELVQRKTLAAFGLVALGIAGNMGRIFHEQGSDIMNHYIGGIRTEFYPVRHFLRFSLPDFVAHPFIVMDHEPGFWNFFLKTMLYGLGAWRHSGILAPLPSALNIMLVVFLLFTVGAMAFTLLRNRTAFKELLPHLMGIVVALTGVIGFTIVQQYQFCQNLRYVLPMLVPMVILFAHGMENLRTTHRLRVLYRLGMAVGLSLPLGGVILYLSQF